MKHPGNRIIRIIGVVFIGLSLIAGTTLSAYATDGLIADKYASEISDREYDHDTVISDALRPSDESNATESHNKSDENILVGARYRDEIVSFAQNTDDLDEISDALNPYTMSDETDIYQNPSANIDDAQTGALIENSEVEVLLYKDAERKEYFDERPVNIKITGSLPEDCRIEAYPVIFSMEGYDVIEAWNVTIFDKAGNVYEPGDNPVKVTISSDSLLQMSRGEVDIYHIATKDELENSLTGSDDGKDKEKAIPEEQTDEESADSAISENESEEEELIVEAAQSIDEESIDFDDEPQEEIVGAALSLTDEEIAGAAAYDTEEEIVGDAISDIEDENTDASYNDTEDAIIGASAYDTDEEIVGASEPEDEWLVEDAETFSEESIDQDAPVVDTSGVLFVGLEVTADDGTTLYLDKIDTVDISDTEDSITFDVNEFSGIAAVRADEPLVGAFVDTNKEVDTSDFLEINLFNYQDLTNTGSGKGNDLLNNFGNVGKGINLTSQYNGSLRDFRFYSQGIKKLTNERYTINNYTGGHSGDTYDNQSGYQNYPVPLQGIVQNKLYDTNGQESADGYPVLAYGAAYRQYTNGPWAYPQYNGYSNNASLAYLFTENQGNIYGRTGTYNGLNKLFYINNDGMYEYDSKKYYAYYDTRQGNGGEFVLREANGNTNLRGFFPFDYFEDNSSVGPGQGYEHHFGMTMTADFYISPDGLVPKLNNNANSSGYGQAIPDGNGGIVKTTEKFTFTGDDDLWVFIDGVLVLDVGGVHQPIDGTIDFASGKVTVNDTCWANNTSASDQYKQQNAVARVGDTHVTKAQTLYLSDLLGQDWNNPYKKHTIKVFYIERGSNDSNLKLQFNMPSTKQIDITKTVFGEDANSYKDEEFGFQLFLQDLQVTNEEKYEVFNPHKVNENLDIIGDLNLGNDISKVSGYHENNYLSQLDIYFKGANDSDYRKLDEDEILARFDDDGVFRLKHGEHMKVGGLIEMQKYFVRELPEGDRFQTYVDNIPDKYETDHGVVSLNSTAGFENRTIKRKIEVEKQWEDVPFAEQPEQIVVSLRQKDYVRIHFSGSVYDNMADPVRVPRGENFSFNLGFKQSQNTPWSRVHVLANGTELTTTDTGAIRTYTVPGSITDDPVDVYINIDSNVTNLSGNTSYNRQLNTYPAEECMEINPLEYVKLSVVVKGQLYNAETQEYEPVNLDELGGDYAVLKEGGDYLDVTTSNGVGFSSLIPTGLFGSGTEQNLAGGSGNLKSSGSYSFSSLDGDTTLNIELKGGQETTLEDLKHALTLSLKNESDEELSPYVEPSGNITIKNFNMTKPANASTPWLLNLVDPANPSQLNEDVDHYYEYEIDEIYVIKDGNTIPLKEAGYSKTVEAKPQVDEMNGGVVTAHKLPFTVTNKPGPVDLTLIKTSSVELPQGDETMAYEILPGVEFALFERTTQIVEEGGQQVEKVILTPVTDEIASDSDGKVFLTGLERGKTYVLKETKAAEGYFLPENGWTIAVSAEGKISISGQDNYAATYVVPTEGEFAGCYRISNVKMYTLPSTGGPGNYMFTIIGIAISALIVMLKLKDRREERAA